MKLAVGIVLSLIAMAVTASGPFEWSAAAEPVPGADQASPAPSANGTGILQGQLVKIEGDLYVIKDAGGKEVRVRVDKATVLDSRIKVGDKIDVQMAAGGHAATILKALQ